MNWKLILVAALFMVGIYETFTKQGAIEKTVDVFLDDPIRGSFLTIERWVTWEALTPVIPIGTSPGGSTIFLFWYSLWDTAILGFFGVMFILLGKATGKWTGSKWNWIALAIFLMFIWFLEKGIWHSMWINNNEVMYGLTAAESDEMLLATSNMAIGVIGILNMIVSGFVLWILFGWLGRVG